MSTTPYRCTCGTIITLGTAFGPRGAYNEWTHATLPATPHKITPAADVPAAFTIPT